VGAQRDRRSSMSRSSRSFLKSLEQIGVEAMEIILLIGRRDPVGQIFALD